MKKAVKNSFAKIRFGLSASNNPVFTGYYKMFFKPEPGTLNELLSMYSKHIGKEFTVIQVGANDGITHDPIHKFIKRDRWNGVLLEPQKYVFDKYLTRIYKKHDNIHVVNAAMGYEDGTLPMYKIGFSTERWATGLATFDKATLEKAFTSGHVARKCAKEKIKIPSDVNQQIIEERVKVRCAESLLKEYNIKKIDLLMIDTEGFDLEVIKMFDIAKNQPGMIIFESSHLSDTEIKEAEELLTKNGYDHKKDGPNMVAIKSGLNQYLNYFK
ncbi:MAG: FkbM family methyltransferase [Crocinitomicaceae bacterium]|nr:FkbM family methyltransferase [Crocinitomicaceae bacterium]